MKNVAIITGASSGFGKALALKLNKYFSVDEIWLIARRKERLQTLAEEITVPTKILPLDVTDEKDVEKLQNLLKEESPCVKVLINNAGLGYYGDFKDMNTEKIDKMINVNVLALTKITSACLPYTGEGGRILNVSSIASFVPNAYMSVYSSTKAYVTSFSRALNYELKEKKIKCSIVCPGPMETEFEKVGEVTSRKFMRLPFCKVDKVAKGALKSLKKGKFIYTNRFVYKFYRILAKILPQAWLMKTASC